MWVKICANTNVEDALLAAELGADAVGFVFAPSKRRVTLEEASEIVDGLPPGVEKVGVFASDDPYEVEHGIACAGLTVAQLHGAFDGEMVRLLSEEFGGKLKIVQTVAYELDAVDRAESDARFEAQLHAAMSEPAVWAVLLDAAKGGASGGLGVAFDWARVGGLVHGVVKRMEDAMPRVILAGGLRAETVAEAIRVFRPWGVDVASGVEASPGKKDAERLQAFLTAAKGATV